MKTLRLLLILVLCASLPLAAPVEAQNKSNKGETEKKIKTRRTPTMRESVYKKLSEAQIAAEENRLEDALELIRDIGKIKKLNSYEMAQMHSFFAYIYYSQENYPASISSYRQVLEQEELPEALELSTLYTLAQLYLVQEDYQSAIDYLNRWFAVANNPNGSAYYLLATSYYQLDRFREALAPIIRAIELGSAGGSTARSLENWYVLLRGLYFELDDYRKFADTLEIMTRLFPKKEYWMQLSSAYGQLEQETKQLMTLEFVYRQGMFSRGQEYTNLAQLLMQAEIPYRGAVILEEGFDKGFIERDERNLRLLSQSYVMSQEDAKAIVPLAAAAKISDDGQLYYQLANSQLNLKQDSDAADSARKALKKGGLKRKDQVHILLGMALYNLDRLENAKSSFRDAQTDKRSRKVASQWINFINKEQQRLKQLEDF
jgi:tetratricopeptide (TPR) repeat protein